jgi:hypothetical protein
VAFRRHPSRPWTIVDWFLVYSTKLRVYVPPRLDRHRRRSVRDTARCLSASFRQLPFQRCCRRSADCLTNRLLPALFRRRYRYLRTAPVCSRRSLRTILNITVATGQFQAAYKTAYLTLIIKKAGLDVEDVCSYRSISNLTVVSKVTERLIARACCPTSSLLPTFCRRRMQSGFRPLHSKETAILKVLSDLLAVDRGDVAVLALLDLYQLPLTPSTTRFCFDAWRSRSHYRRCAVLVTVILDRPIPVRSSRC